MAWILQKLTGPDGRTSRERFFILGVTLFALKFMIDRLVARLFFDRDWSLLNYLIPNETYALPMLPAGERLFYLTMVVVAAPFAAVGILLTCARLWDAGLPRALALLFFIPGVNLLFFAVMSVLGPQRAISAKIPVESPDESPDFAGVLEYGRDELRPSQRQLFRILPAEPGRSAVVAALVTAAIADAITVLGTLVLRDYGWGLFVGMPFAVGMIAALLHGYRFPRTVGQSIFVGCLALLFSATGMIVFAVEGLGCLIMLLPLAAPVTICGALLGHSIQLRPGRGAGSPNTLWTILLALPLLMGAEAVIPRAPAVFEVVTSVEINAPPSRVWQHVVAFSRIDPPTELLFRAGVAYPIQARIVGSGVGAIRYCEFSTGAFVEPIEIWDEPHLLRFSVTDNPPPMKEFSPFNIHPPHLKNFLIARQGQFKLTTLPGNRTLLEGTTWYEHRMWPQTYWKWWSDAIIHHIHARVLEHVRQMSESPIDDAVELAHTR